MEINDHETGVLVQSALADIMFMYRDLVTTYRGFGHNIRTGGFDPFVLSRAYITGTGWYTSDDLKLLYAGCGVKIFCQLSDLWDECGPDDVAGTDWVRRVRAFLDDGAEFLPLDIRDAMAFSLDEEPPREMLQAIYQTHVIGTFAKLAHS